MKTKQTLYIIIEKETGKAETMLIGDWCIIPTFTKRKYALEFMKESMSTEKLKVIKFTIL